MTCPHPSLCDRRVDFDLGIRETYEEYVRRHAKDHGLGEFSDPTSTNVVPFHREIEPTPLRAKLQREPGGLEDAEANLGAWCLYFCNRYVIGNASIGTGDRIVAAYEPCWEDAEYLANWIFSLKDLEQEPDAEEFGSHWHERTFRLPPYAERDHENATYKRFKKLTKVRDTQKTSWAKAYITFRQIHAYFVEGRPHYRVLVISAVSTLARLHYLAPLKELWSSNGNIRRLYGTVEYTKRGEALLAKKAKGKYVDLDLLEAETRELGLLKRGSYPKDTLRCRWLIERQTSDGMTAISLMVMGMESTSGGNRWDLIVIDDPISIENSATSDQRRKVERKIADLRKQGDADSEFLYLNTPYDIDDASAKVDREHSDEYHILYRPGMWFDTATSLPVYYWQYNALAPGKPVKNKPPRNAVWPVSRVDAESRQPDFTSQVLLRARDPKHALFNEEDFEIVDPENAPLEVRAGLGGAPITDEEKAWLTADGAQIHRYLLIDPAGNETASNLNAETAIIGVAIATFGVMFIYRIVADRMTATVEEDAIFESWEYSNGAEVVRYEVVSAGKKMVEKNFARFQAEKSRSLGRPVMIPFVFPDAAATKSKEVRVPQMQPYVRSGRVKILRNAAPMPLIKRFIRQFVDWPSSRLKDMADALSMIQEYTTFDPYVQQQEEERRDMERPRIDEDGHVTIPSNFVIRQAGENGTSIMEIIAGAARGRVSPWGKRGGSVGDE